MDKIGLIGRLWNLQRIYLGNLGSNSKHTENEWPEMDFARYVQEFKWAIRYYGVGGTALLATASVFGFAGAYLGKSNWYSWLKQRQFDNR